MKEIPTGWRKQTSTNITLNEAQPFLVKTTRKGTLVIMDTDFKPDYEHHAGNPGIVEGKVNLIFNTEPQQVYPLDTLEDALALARILETGELG